MSELTCGNARSNFHQFFIFGFFGKCAFGFAADGPLVLWSIESDTSARSELGSKQLARDVVCISNTPNAPNHRDAMALSSHFDRMVHKDAWNSARLVVQDVIRPSQEWTSCRVACLAGGLAIHWT